MFVPGGVGEWSPPQSPFGGFRGRKENHNLFKRGGLCPGADSYSQQRMLATASGNKLVPSVFSNRATTPNSSTCLQISEEE